MAYAPLWALSLPPAFATRCFRALAVQIGHLAFFLVIPALSFNHNRALRSFLQSLELNPVQRAVILSAAEPPPARNRNTTVWTPFTSPSIGISNVCQRLQSSLSGLGYSTVPISVPPVKLLAAASISGSIHTSIFEPRTYPYESTHYKRLN